MSLTATTEDDQGKRPSQTIPVSPRPLSPSLTNPADPSDVEAATLQHRQPPAVEDPELGPLGLEDERPGYEDDVAEEIGGDYDHAVESNLNDDDEGDDGGLDVDENGHRDLEGESYDEALEEDGFDAEDADQEVANGDES